MVSNQWFENSKHFFFALISPSISRCQAYFSGLDIDPEEAGVPFSPRDGGDGW